MAVRPIWRPFVAFRSILEYFFTWKKMFRIKNCIEKCPQNRLGDIFYHKRKISKSYGYHFSMQFFMLFQNLYLVFLQKAQNVLKSHFNVEIMQVRRTFWASFNLSKRFYSLCLWAREPLIKSLYLTDLLKSPLAHKKGCRIFQKC